MSNYRTTATHQMNKWLWSKLQDIMYKGEPAFKAYAPHGTVNLVPIVPSQQVQQMMDISGGAPFIVYNYTVMAASEWWLQSEQASYIIYDNDEERLRQIHTYISQLLRRQDWTAQEINDWVLDGIEPGTQADVFDFKSVTLISATGPEPYESQGGRQGALIAARIMYTHELQQDGMRI